MTWPSMVPRSTSPEALILFDTFVEDVNVRPKSGIRERETQSVGKRIVWEASYDPYGERPACSGLVTDSKSTRTLIAASSFRRMGGPPSPNDFHSRGPQDS